MGFSRAAGALVPAVPLRQRVREAVLGPRLEMTGWFNRHLPDSTWSKPTNPGARDYSAPLWTLLMFEAFLRQVVDASVASAPLNPAPALAEAA
jgi:asparagine synthase (glutamine-hydrolysing)